MIKEGKSDFKRRAYTFLRQRLFDASVVDKVSRLSQDFLSTATSIESAQIGYGVMERPGSKLAKSVMDWIVRF